ncbi:MAG: PAS domain S-box protein [Myxococcales bacterium]|nr:PAS domain S-box protein [Myxococcales bacterium]
MKDRPGATADAARLRTILDSMVEAVFVTDEKGRVVMTNPALDALSAEDVIGWRAKNVIKNKELRRAIRRARRKGEAAVVELETTIGGTQRAINAQVAPLPHGDGVVTVIHDVTSLREADRIRRDFIANASHELRTPLTAIRAFTETLQDGALDNPDKARTFLDRILRQTLRLQRLVEDLTRLSQAESPMLDEDSEVMDVRAVCAQVVSSLESYARKKGVRLLLETPDQELMVEASPRSLEHILINLVENAIKHSPEGAEVRVRGVRRADQVLLEVKDQGPGIPPQHHKRIFERFYRVDEGRSRDDGGTGLGLSIVKNLAERLGGAVEVESEPGQGALFRVSLPFDAEGGADREVTEFDASTD